jgi:hypothetical protein
MTKRIKLPPFGAVLIILATLSNTGRWVGMYLVSDNAPTWVWSVTPFLNVFSALSTALSIAGGLLFVTHRLGNLQPMLERKVRGKDETRTIVNIRFWTAAAAGVGILVMSAFLLPPYIRMMLPDELSAEIGSVKAWSVMSVLVGDLVIVAIAMADGKSAVFTRSPSAGSQSKPLSKPQAVAQPRKRSLSKVASEIKCRYAPQCQREFRTQNAANAHARTCGFKPTVSMPVEEHVHA